MNDSFAILYAHYDRYVHEQEAKNAKPVSFLRYAFGNF